MRDLAIPIERMGSMAPAARNDREPVFLDDFKAVARDEIGRWLAEKEDVRSYATMAMFHEGE